MPKTETLVLRVMNPNAQHHFYCEALGMKDLGDRHVGYGGDEARIRFLQADTPYDPKPNDLYWKIALAVPNIELACRQLMEKGVSVSAPRQFEDVGYLAHFVDPEGFTIELIEHWFKGKRQTEKVDPSLLGGGAHFNLITLRAADIEPVKQTCADWGMTPLSVQHLVSYGFSLYFFAFTSDTPPVPDLTAVANREWLYQRKYTVLEVQHVETIDTVCHSEPGAAGYAGTVFSGMSDDGHHDGLLVDLRGS